MNTKAKLNSLFQSALPISALQRNPRALLPTFVVFLTLCTQTSVASADNPKVFDIESQNLAAALTQFAAQSDRQILFSTEVADSKRSNGVKGELEPEIALHQ